MVFCSETVCPSRNVNFCGGFRKYEANKYDPTFSKTYLNNQKRKKRLVLSLVGGGVHLGMPRGPVSVGPRRRQGSGATGDRTTFSHCRTGGGWYPPIGRSDSSSVAVRGGDGHGSGELRRLRLG